MCGIAGFWGASGTLDEKLMHLASVGEKLKNRGPDDLGDWVDEADNVFMTHRRLSIIDTRTCGRQPMRSANGRWVLSYNGEVYNYQEIRKTLEDCSYEFDTATDTEVILNAIDHWGIESAVKKFRGMFAFAVYDLREKLIYLVRDRFGIKPLYYSRLTSGWAFGSQLSAISESPGFRSRLNPNATRQYFLLNHVPRNECIFTNTWRIQPGEILVFPVNAKSEDPKRIIYWDTRDEIERGLKNPLNGDDLELMDGLKAQLSEAIRLRMIADVPLGAFLSGGIDSSLIVSMMQEISSKPINTFTIGVDSDGYDECQVASSISKHLGCNHTEHKLEESEVIDFFPSLIEIYDEPFSDSSQLPTFIVSKLARNDVTVCLSGDAGDEVFGGYNRYTRGVRIWEKLGGMPGVARNTIANLLASPASKSIVTFRNQFLADSKKIQNIDEKLDKVSRAIKSENEPDLYMRLISHLSSRHALLKDQDHLSHDELRPLAGFSSDLSLLHNMMMSDTLGYLEGDILTKVDRASMAVSLEARIPYLDHVLFAYAWRLPDRLRIQKGQGKWILRQILKEYVPDELMNQEKHGFAIPLANWFRTHLRDWVIESLNEASIKRFEILDEKTVQNLLSEHLSGTRNHENLIWSIIVFQRWCERFKL